MPDGIHDAGRRDALLRLPLGDLIAWHLLVTCPGCGEDRRLPVLALSTRFGSATTLAMLLGRLRCREQASRRRPSVVRLRNRSPGDRDGPRLVDVVLKEHAELHVLRRT